MRRLALGLAVSALACSSSAEPSADVRVAGTYHLDRYYGAALPTPYQIGGSASTWPTLQLGTLELLADGSLAYYDSASAPFGKFLARALGGWRVDGTTLALTTQDGASGTATSGGDSLVIAWSTQRMGQRVYRR